MIGVVHCPIANNFVYEVAIDGRVSPALYLVWQR